MKITKIAKNELPGDATHGFRVDTGDPATSMFFHWTDQGYIEIPGRETDEEGRPTVETMINHPRTSYADVLKALPDRLAAVGLEKETDGLLGEVVGMFGAGE